MSETKEVKTPSVKEQEIMLGDEGFIRYFNKIKKILKEYMDMSEGAYTIVSLWILGTYLHKQFSSYPYLYFNAMKGSGKTRMLNIIANLSKNGNLIGSLTEAVLFRTASERSICIDEFESMNAKGNENLKLLLNSAYKRGLKVSRMIKKKEEQALEEFEVYCPIVMANIWGMENVLSDRCISVILEKSSRKEITRLIENFEYNTKFKVIIGGMLRITENMNDTLNYLVGVFDEWNNFVKGLKYNEKYKELFLKIDKENIEGRNLELFFPLFIIADMISVKVLDEVLEISKKIIKDRKDQDRENNSDIKIYEFVAQYENTDFLSVADLVKQFKEFGEYGESDNWVNARWFGRGLRRLNLVVDDRRRQKREVRLDIEKAKEKLKMFIEPNKQDFQEELKGVL